MKKMAKEQIIRFIPMTERYPDPFEACLILDCKNRLSIGSWISTDEENREGNLCQGHHGIYEKNYVKAWVAVEKYNLANKGDRILLCYDG